MERSEKSPEANKLIRRIISKARFHRFKVDYLPLHALGLLIAHELIHGGD